MSRTLSLIQAGWESVRAAAERGQRGTALDQLERVLARPDVPAELVVEGHRFAAELTLELGRYASARRHLKILAEVEPNDAKTRYLQGLAWEEDPDGCDRRAAICFKKAVSLDGANSLFRAAFGRAAVRCGKVKRGTREMLAAADSAPGDLAVVRVAVSGLLDAGKVAKARTVIAKARFLCPGNAGLAALWERVKFEAARLAQWNGRKSAKLGKTSAKTRYAQDAHFATDGDRVTLPLLRLADEGTAPKGTAGRGETTRRDGPSFPRPHLARLRARKADC